MPLARPLHSTLPRAGLGHLRRRRVVTASLATVAARRAFAQAQWPERPVRLLVSLPAGGGAGDALARSMAPALAAAFGQPFVVDNRPGGGGTIAAAAVAQAADRHTIGVVLPGALTTARALNPATPYDPATAFAPVSLLDRMPFLLVVHPAVPARDAEAFVAFARTNPGRLSYATLGPGTITHLATEEMKDRLGLDLVHVPYRGGAQALLDLRAGRVQAMLGPPAAMLPPVREGALVALAQTGEAELAALPGVPTWERAGLAGDSLYGWNALVAPAGFPPEVAARVAAVAREALARDAALRGSLEAAGGELVGSPPEALARHLRRETARWTAVVARLGLRATD